MKGPADKNAGAEHLIFITETGMEYEYYPESEIAEKKKKKPFSAKKLIKWLIIALIAGVYLLIFIRIFITNIDPQISKSYIWTAESVRAYNSDKDSFKVQNQQIKSFVVPEPDGSYTRVVYNVITDDGYYHISNFMYNEATKELIISVRFNNASLENLRDKYDLPSTPGADAYVFALDKEGEYDYNYSYTYKNVFGYHFCRLVFSGVELSDYDTIDLNVYYAQNVVLSAPLGYLTIYDSRIPVEYYDIKDALPAKERSDLNKSPYIIPKDE